MPDNAAVQPAQIATAPVQTSGIKSKSTPDTPALSHPSSAVQQPVPESPKPEPAQALQPLPSTPAEDPKTTEQLKELGGQLDLLSIRADAVKDSLEKLRRQQANAGMGLRADMANAAQRMELYLSQTETALKRRNADAAKKNLDLAEREVSKLEDFLHR